MNFSIYWRVFFAAIIILAEILLVSFKIDARLITGGESTWLLFYMGDILRWLIVCTCLSQFLIYYYSRQIISNSKELIKAPFLFYQFFLHVLIYGCFVYITLELYGSESDPDFLLAIFWYCLAALVAVTWCWTFFTLRITYQFLKKNFFYIALSSVMALLIVLVNHWFEKLWKPLSFIALNGSHWLLSLFFNDIFIDVPNKYLGIGDFIVHIAPVCSGLEGLIIVISVTSIYLFILRNELIFPLSFLLIPIAGLLAILFNIFRLTALISLGVTVSPEIAIGGFHSVAGWIAAVIVSSLIIFLFSSLPFFYREKGRNNSEHPQNNDSDLAWAILIPFVVFLSASLGSNLYVDDFDFFYPLKIVASSSCLFYYWKYYQLKFPTQWLVPIVAGLVIAILWILLSPQNPEYDREFMVTLESLPLWFAILWSIFRLIGFWFIVPIIEELVFRGYLIARLSKQELTNKNNLSFSLLTVVISSIIFGFIHSAFIAGVIAGVIFAVVRYRTSTLSEPILSHIAANVFVAIWAIFSGQWGLL